MIEASWLLFILASLAVILTPGQDMMLVMSRSLARPTSCISGLRCSEQSARISSSGPLSVFALGATFAALTFLIKGPVGIFAGALSGWLRSRPAVLAWVYRSSGAILIGLGAKLAFERR